MSLSKNDKPDKTMKKLCFTIFTLILITSPVVLAQYGSRQAGLRMGYRGGIFYQVTQEAGTAEIGYNAMLGFYNHGIQVTGLRVVYETSISSISPNLFFGWGYGGHIGYIYTDHVEYFGDTYYYTKDHFSPVIGADGWLTAEYRIRDIPLNISLNLKPFVEVTIPAFVKIMPFDFAISMSYVF
jgi:hypothetical protein